MTRIVRMKQRLFAPFAPFDTRSALFRTLPHLTFTQALRLRLGYVKVETDSIELRE
jgi:hypothetical protein